MQSRHPFPDLYLKTSVILHMYSLQILLAVCLLALVAIVMVCLFSFTPMPSYLMDNNPWPGPRWGPLT